MKQKFYIAKTVLLFASLCLLWTLMADSSASAKLKGKGTGDSPYQIKTAKDLFEFAGLVNSSKPNTICDLCAVLKKDIVINDICVDDVDIEQDENGVLAYKPKFTVPDDTEDADGEDEDSEDEDSEDDSDEADKEYVNESDVKKWTPIGYINDDAYVLYGGEFDGNEHTIRGLYVNDNNMDFAGLFAATYQAHITDLTIADSFISGRCYVGGFAGVNYISRIEGCWFDDSEYDNPSVVAGSIFVGGICGEARDAWNADEKTSFLGKHKWNIIKNSFNFGCVAGDYGVGSICGVLYYGTTKRIANFGSVICPLYDEDEADDILIGIQVKPKEEADSTDDEEVQEAADMVQDAVNEASNEEDKKDTVNEIKNDIKENNGDERDKPDNNTVEGSDERQENKEKMAEVLGGADGVSDADNNNGNSEGNKDVSDNDDKDTGSSATAAPTDDSGNAGSDNADQGNSGNENGDTAKDGSQEGKPAETGSMISSGNPVMVVIIVAIIAVVALGFMIFTRKRYKE